MNYKYHPLEQAQVITINRIPGGVLPYRLLHSPIDDESPLGLDELPFRLSDQGLEQEMQFRVVTDSKTVLLSLSLALGPDGLQYLFRGVS